MGEQFHKIYQALASGQAIAVATIVSDAGSTPRSSGSKMIVYPNGNISGTIGGGAVEGDVIQRALRLFKTGGAEIELVHGLNEREVALVKAGGVVNFLKN